MGADVSAIYEELGKEQTMADEKHYDESDYKEWGHLTKQRARRLAMQQGTSFNDLVTGFRTATPYELTQEYFSNLIENTHNFELDETKFGMAYKSTNPAIDRLTFLRDDILLLMAPEYKTVVRDFAGAGGESAYMKTLSAAWTKLMNADRYDGPTRNVCDDPSKNIMLTPPTKAEKLQIFNAAANGQRGVSKREYLEAKMFPGISG